MILMSKTGPWFVKEEGLEDCEFYFVVPEDHDDIIGFKRLC